MVLLTAAFAPTWALFIGIVLILIADILFREKAKEYIVIISTLTLVASAALAIRAFDANIDGGSLFRFEIFYLAFSLFGLISSIIVVIASWNDLEIELDLGVFLFTTFISKHWRTSNCFITKFNSIIFGL